MKTRRPRQRNPEVQSPRSIVAQGFTQTRAFDYNETVTPFAKFASLRAIISLAAEHSARSSAGLAER
jgi:hypothetical protein